MTLRKQIWLSHFTVLLVPLLVTFVIIVIDMCGVALFIHNGIQFSIEGPRQFRTFSTLSEEISYHCTKKNEIGWLNFYYSLVSNSSYYATVSKNGHIVYASGDKHVGPEGIASMQLPMGVTSESFYYGNREILLSTRVDGKDLYRYELYVDLAPHGSDKIMDHAFAVFLALIPISVLAAVILTTALVVRMFLHYIRRPLQALDDGSRRVMTGDYTSKIDYDKNDEFLPIVNSFNEMTTQLQATEHLKASQAKKQCALLTGISHDIRTPLTSIKAYATGLLDGIAKNEEKRHHYLETIVRKTDELDGLLQRLLMLTALDSLQDSDTLTPLDPRELVADYIEQNKYGYEEQGLFLVEGEPIYCDSLSADAGEGLILMDRTVWRRVLNNFCSNSVKYKDEATCTATISLAYAPDSVSLIYADTGPGVPKETLGRLFDAFYRVDTARTRTAQGSGLGLSIVTRIMKSLGGSVRAELNQPRGLKIICTFPLYKDA